MEDRRDRILCIRTATLKDYGAVDALWQEEDRYHAQLVPDVFRSDGAGPARPREFFEKALQSPESTILVAERGGNTCPNIKHSYP